MSTVTNVASDEALTRDAYARVKADWATLQAEELVQVNLDLHVAQETVLGAWVRLKTFREQIVKDLPSFDLAWLDKLQDYALALRFVQSRYIMATKGAADLDELVAQCNKLCDILEADARALARRGLFSTEKLDALQGGNSFKALADDLEALSNELHAIFPQIQGKCAVTDEDLKAGTQMATRLTRLLGEQQLSPAAVNALAEERQRAFTQLLKAYEETRAAILFLRRREGDADKIAPNLHAENSRRRRTPEASVAPTPISSTPAVPATSVPATAATPAGNGSAPTAPGAPSTSSPFMS